MRRFPRFVPTALVGIMVVFANGCVDVSETGITPPDYDAQARVIYADPALSTATLSLANGPSFASFTDLPAGTFGAASDYATYKAGAKKIYVKRGDGTLADNDTTTLTLGTETVSTLIVLPRRDTIEARILQVVERSTFAMPGIADFARVRFTNCLTSKDTVDVWRIPGASAPGIGSNNLPYARTSAFFNVPKDSTWRFYSTRHTGSTTGVGDTVSITGASNKQFTAVLYDSLAQLKVLVVEDR